MQILRYLLGDQKRPEAGSHSLPLSAVS